MNISICMSTPSKMRCRHHSLHSGERRINDQRCYRCDCGRFVGVVLVEDSQELTGYNVALKQERSSSE